MSHPFSLNFHHPTAAMVIPAVMRGVRPNSLLNRPRAKYRVDPTNPPEHR